ncbi:MAG: glycosyltransferase family 2 protein [Pirellula sp.]|jgi:glycosyltransferase involved in cell wall biosynthesis
MKSSPLKIESMSPSITPSSSRTATSLKTMSPTTLSVVIPCFNEAACIVGTLAELHSKLEMVQSVVPFQYEIILVDDGSTDETWQLIQRECASRACVKGIRLRGNAGQQAALLCGYSHALGDWVLTLDADLQDPPEVLTEMFQATLDSAQIIIGRRRSRNVDTWLKRLTAFGFYRSMRLLGINEGTMQAGDFRMMSRMAVQDLVRTSHHPLFHRFKVFELGYPVLAVEYDRRVRTAGETKYSYRKMIALSLQAAWSQPRTRRRLGQLCLLGQTLFTMLFAVIVSLGWDSRIWIILGSLQLMSLALFLIPSICFMWERLENAPCFHVAERCQSPDKDRSEKDNVE